MTDGTHQADRGLRLTSCPALGTPDPVGSLTDTASTRPALQAGDERGEHDESPPFGTLEINRTHAAREALGVPAGPRIRVTPEKLTQGHVRQLADELRAARPGPVTFDLDRETRWPDEPLKLLGQLWQTTSARHTVRLTCDGVEYPDPVDFALGSFSCSAGETQAVLVERLATLLHASFPPAERAARTRQLAAKLEGLGVGPETLQLLDRPARQEPAREAAPEVIDPGNPTALARRLLQRLASRPSVGPNAEGFTPLLHHGGHFYGWEGVWRKISPGDMRARVTRFLQGCSPVAKITRSLVDNVLLNLEGFCAIGRSGESLPFYIDSLGDEAEIRRRTLLAVANGLVDLEPLERGGNPALLPTDPRWFSTTALQFGYDPAAQCPQFLAFLAEVLERDPRTGTPLGGGDLRLEVLQEWFGYALLPDGRFQSFLLMVGDGANGKGVILDLLTKLLGPENVSNVGLDRFGDRFGLQPLLGKTANICGDLNEIDKVAEGLLKQLCGGDTVEVDQKHRDSAKLGSGVKLIFSTNMLPRFSDRSEGIWRRLVAIPFRITVPGHRRDALFGKRLEKELPGILNWALAGLARLLKQGRFTECSVCEACARRHRHNCDPVAVFLEEEGYYSSGTPDPTRRISSRQLYDEFAAWAKSSGYKGLGIQKFSDLIGRLPGVQAGRNSVGERRRCWIGVGKPLGRAVDNPRE
ncbi:MAG: phage/plasmid primase, P4 family [Isosphaeraceae bacterium]